MHCVNQYFGFEYYTEVNISEILERGRVMINVKYINIVILSFMNEREIKHYNINIGIINNNFEVLYLFHA